MLRSISDLSSNGLDAAATPIVPHGGSGAGLINLRHHVLDLRVVLERVRGEVLAVAGLLEATVRHLADQRDVVVDPDGAELQLPRRIERAADVAGPHRRAGPGADGV